jgi:hypothetical protein
VWKLEALRFIIIDFDALHRNIVKKINATIALSKVKLCIKMWK